MESIHDSGDFDSWHAGDADVTNSFSSAA